MLSVKPVCMALFLPTLRCSTLPLLTPSLIISAIEHNSGIPWNISCKPSPFKAYTAGWLDGLIA